MRTSIVIAMALLLAASSATAALKYTGEGDNLRFDPASISAEMREPFALMSVKCNNAKCHTIARAAIAVRAGVTPITSTPFNKTTAKAYGIKMMRRPDSGINKAEAKVIVELLYWLIEKQGE